MPVGWAELILAMAGGYALAGLVVGIAFLLFGIERCDAAAIGAHGFRPLLLPGLALFWPLVIRRWKASAAPAIPGLPGPRLHLGLWLALALLLPALLLGAAALCPGTSADAPLRLSQAAR